MAWTAPRTWVTGEIVTAALMNTHVRDNLLETVQRDGSVPLTANWDAGSFEIRAETLESDVVTGTAPLTVASTTVVTNLNTDQVDGQHRTININADHTHQSTGAQAGQLNFFGLHSAGIFVKRKTADQTVTASTTLVNDTHLLFAIAANEEWIAEFVVYSYAIDADADLRVNITVPASATLRFGPANAKTSAGGVFATTSYNSDGSSYIAFPADTNVGVHSLKAWILNSSNAGNVQFQFACDTAVDAVTLKQGSYLIAYRVA